ncbi:hypothetical protein U9M48_002073 [Paspalum notatum var. saurae]|uniref:F-box domain-containing protein n=1 Tax=Paspalum notatum var. saurae TaxID=547442 RepID=A0AAQ3PH86_PASNO
MMLEGRLSVEDRISDLPDELLHAILVRLRCAGAAARTSVLSRRWRHVWAHIPELNLDEEGIRPDPAFLHTVDGALAGYSSPTLDRLRISVPRPRSPGPTRPAVAALRLRARGGRALHLRVYLVPRRRADGVKADVLDLAAWEGVTEIRLHLGRLGSWQLRPPSTGFFSALTSLRIDGGHIRMAGSDLTALVSRQCPRLRHLNLSVALDPDAALAVFLHSDSLHSLWLKVTNVRQLEVVAPRLEELTVVDATKTLISAPNLAKLVWVGNKAYDPRYHQFLDDGRRLRLLEIGRCSVATPLVRRFEEVDELKLNIQIPQGRDGYQRFWVETNKLPKWMSMFTILPLHLGRESQDRWSYSKFTRSSRNHEDRISGLPDELLHGILVRLRCACAAARTTVLSRRWRRVWAELPELLLQYDGTRRAPSFMDAVDGALAAYSAPTLEHLSITVAPNHALHIPGPAAGRRAGVHTEVLDLPAWEGVTKIDLAIQQTWRLRPPSAGVFAALTSLTIKGGRMARDDLAALVCTQCPRLRDLNLDLDARHEVVSLSSNSLHSLRLLLRNARHLQVVAPRLDELSVYEAVKAHVAAPKLVKLAWHGNVYDPHQHHLLPDELLHDILVRLRSARAAARTSVLSRRWRHVWAHLPELVLLGSGPHASSFLDAVDGALAGYSAPTLDRLTIILTAFLTVRHGLRVPAAHVEPCFASLRFGSGGGHPTALALRASSSSSSSMDKRRCHGNNAPATGTASLCLCYVGDNKEAVHLPASKAVTNILLRLHGAWRLRPPSAGVFAALTSLTIKGGGMAGSDLTDLVCTKCPRLRDLDLSLALVAAFDVSLRSNSLRSVRLDIRDALRLEVVAPTLEELTVDDAPRAAHISAPNLAELAWRAGAYYHRHDQLFDVGRRLRRLKMSMCSLKASLIQQFDEVDELQLQIHIPQFHYWRQWEEEEREERDDGWGPHLPQPPNNFPTSQILCTRSTQAGGTGQALPLRNPN